MKKSLLTIILTVLFASSVSAQNVARECVLIEAFTGINCGFCPAAAGAISEMINQGLSIAPLAFHNSYYSPAIYATSETNGRATFYNVAGFPTVVVDGLARPAVGGMAYEYESSYERLKAEYDKRINVESPFTIELTFDYHSGSKCEAKAIVKKVAECNGEDIRVFIALAESHIPQNWGGWSELNAVVRDIVTSTSGAKLVGETSEITALFDVHQWKKENCELVAWVQATSGGNREVYQAVKIPIGTEAADFDLAITNVENVPAEICSGIVEPLFTIKNCGMNDITSVNFVVTNDADEELMSYKWEGNLSQGAEEEFKFPEIDFGNAAYAKIEALNINGSNFDKYTFDNVFKTNTDAPYNIPDDGLLNFQIKSSEAENISIDIINMDKGEVLKTITLPESNKLYKEEYTLPEHGCYRVIFKNSEGNGIGDGSFWGIIDGNKKTVVSGKTNENTFRYEYIIELSFGTVGIENVEFNKDMNVFPNPAKSVINVAAPNLNKVTVFNALGQIVYTEMSDTDNVMINVETWSDGLYYVNIETIDGISTSQKVIVNK